METTTGLRTLLHSKVHSVLGKVGRVGTQQSRVLFSVGSTSRHLSCAEEAKVDQEGRRVWRAEWQQQWAKVDDSGLAVVLWSWARRLPVDRQANARDSVSGPGGRPGT